MKLIATILAFLTTLSAEAAQTNTVTDNITAASVLFSFGSRGHIVVPVSVNGLPVRNFLFDTAAGHTALNQNRAEAFSLDRSRFVKARLMRAHGAVDTYMAPLDSISLAGLTAMDTTAVLIDLADMETTDVSIWGILGFDFFGAYDLEIDYPAQRLELNKPNEQALGCPATNEPTHAGARFTLKHGTHVSFPLELNGVTVTAILDTGSSRSGMNSAAAHATGVPVKKTTSEPSGHGNASHGGAAGFIGTTIVEEIQIGGATLETGATVSVVDLPAFTAFGLTDKPAILIGANLLKRHRVSVSYSCNVIRMR